MGEARERLKARWRQTVQRYEAFAREGIAQLAVRGMAYSGAEVARFLGVTTSAVNRLAVAEELPEVRKYLKAL